MEKTYNNSLEYIDPSVSRLINEYNDEIEMEIIKYHDHYKVVVTICQEDPLIRFLLGLGRIKGVRGEPLGSL